MFLDSFDCILTQIEQLEAVQAGERIRSYPCQLAGFDFERTQVDTADKCERLDFVYFVMTQVQAVQIFHKLERIRFNFTQTAMFHVQYSHFGQMFEG